MIELEEIACPFCNIKTADHFWEENGYIGHKCPTCGLIYISPRPTEESMQLLYEKDLAGGMKIQDHFTYHYSKRLYFNHIIKKIQKYCRTGKILEIGVGGGQFLHAAKNKGFDVYGIELNRLQSDIITRSLNIPIDSRTIMQSDFFGIDSFDVIYHNDLLSHLHDPISVHKKLYDKLSHSGLLIFETGNLGDVGKDNLLKWGSLGYPEHVYLYSIKNILDILKQTGFQLVDTIQNVMVTQLYKRKKNEEKILSDSKSNNNEIDRIQIQKLIEIEERKYHEYTFKPPSFSFLQKLKGYLSYVLNYKIGTLFPKSYPSSVIFIAKKGN